MATGVPPRPVSSRPGGFHNAVGTERAIRFPVGRVADHDHLGIISEIAGEGFSDKNDLPVIPHRHAPDKRFVERALGDGYASRSERLVKSSVGKAAYRRRIDHMPFVGSPSFNDM